MSSSLIQQNPGDEVTVHIAGTPADGRGVAELWRGHALLGILSEEQGALVLRLESHAGAPLSVSALELERALAEARAGLAIAPSAGRA